MVDGGEIFLKLDEDYIKTCSLNEKICLRFENTNSIFIPVLLNRTDLLSEAKEKYINKYSYKNENKLKLFWNAKSLEYNLSDTLEDIGLYNNSRIFVLDSVEIRGAGGVGFIDFVDVKTGKVKKLEFSKNAPDWRHVDKGLNIFGFCQNPKCKAYKKEVVHIVGLLSFNYKFDLKKEVTNIKCPICYKIFKAETCGFYKCEYQFSGKMIVEGEIEDYTSEPKETRSDNFEYFDPFKNGKKEWLELIIYVLPKQEIKYKKN